MIPIQSLSFGYLDDKKTRDYKTNNAIYKKKVMVVGEHTSNTASQSTIEKTSTTRQPLNRRTKAQRAKDAEEEAKRAKKVHKLQALFAGEKRESIPKGYEAFVTDMVYLADFTEEGTAAAEQFVQDYTEKIEPEMAYESKGKYAGNYEQFQMMFWMVGGSLSFIIGLVGLLNFINGEVTSILSRKRELAMLQSIGMTGRQMKRMLVLEGILTSGGALILAAVLNLGVYFGMMPVIEDLFWFFQKNFTMTMILAAVPVLLAAGILIPLLVYKRAEKKSIVERLRESEN